MRVWIPKPVNAITTYLTVSRLVFPDPFAENAKIFCGIKLTTVAVRYDKKTLKGYAAPFSTPKFNNNAL